MSKRKTFLVALILSCNLGIYAQGVSLHLRNVTVAKAMTELRKKTGYSFVYEGSDLNTSQRVNVNAKDVRQAADQILGSQNVTYTIQGKNIVVSANGKQSPNRPQNTVKKSAGRRTVRGRITDTNGEPIIGASVKVKGSDMGAVTDLNGNYSVSADPGDELIVSYVGFKTQDVRIGQRDVVNVTISEDNKLLNEVVVVGYGTQKKVDLTGAVSTVSSKELEQRPVQNTAQALQGLVPGLQISATNGELNSGMSINVRGASTIGQGSDGSPLVLIDGVEGDLYSLNPQDIENISVLKDAAASSIYGSRAPFGVILVTTKSGSGSDGKVVVNYNNSFQFNSFIREKKIVNSVDFASYINDGCYNSGQSLWFNDELMNRIVEWRQAKPYGPGTRQKSDGTLIYSSVVNPANPLLYRSAFGYGCDDVDYMDLFYKNVAFSMNHNVSFRGGNKKLNYYASLGVNENNGFIALGKDKYTRYNGTAKINSKVTNWLDLQYSMRYSRVDYQKPTFWTTSIYNGLLRQGWPTVPFYDPHGHILASALPTNALINGGVTKQQRDIINQQLAFVLEPLKNWKTHIEFAYNTTHRNYHEDSQYTYGYNTDESVRLENNNCYVKETAGKDNYMNFQAWSEYDWTMGHKHNFYVMAGFQAEQMKTLAFSAKRNGILDPDKPEIDITTGKDYYGEDVVPEVTGSRNQWQTAGFFGRMKYNYAERYLLEVNLRADGSSRFRRNNMWRLFPSFSTGWRISEEAFMKNCRTWLDNLKLRLSYGSLGNQNTTNWYQTYQIINYQTAAGTWLQDGKNTNIATAPGLVSTSLGWEKVETYNVGLDLNVLHNRLSASFDAYIRNTKDMIGNAPELPSILGANVPVTNNTDLRTTGWELQINWQDRLSNGIQYSVSFNLSDSRSKITRYPNNPTNSIDTYIEGRYLGEIWGYETVGVARSDEEMKKHLAFVDQSSLGSNWTAGDVMYADLNGDYRISTGARTLADHGDLKVIGNSRPRFLFGLNLGIDWKGFDLRAFFQGVAKRDFWMNEKFYFGTNSNLWETMATDEVQDYYRDENSWSVKTGYKKANTNAWLPRIYFGKKNTQVQSRYLSNAAYIRMKNLQLSYTIPRSITSKAKIESLKLYVSAENLLTLTKMPKQFDPEMVGSDMATVNGYPLHKTISFGLNITL